MLNSFVVEANILFASLIKRSGNFKLVLLLPKLGVGLYSPEFVFKEIIARREKLLKYSKLSPSEFGFLMDKLFKNIQVVPMSEYESRLSEAKAIFPEHQKDSPYFALSLKLNIPLWSNEKLHKRQSKIEVYTTSEILKELGLE